MPDRSPVLSPPFRSRLAKTVLEARRTAEAAGRESLDALAVGLPKPYGSLSLTEKGFRNRLRARGRQLGDQDDPQTRRQEIGRLVHEVAYNQWHRLLFARFLADNGLLVEPATGVPLSLDECGDLARELGTDPWTLAGRFAQEMLPGVFTRSDPVLEVTLPPEARLKLQELVESLPREVFLADDSLGWTYQFWQAEQKDEVNQSGVKIGAEELPAVTQLFTERYMVLFLFHNTIGAWRAGKALAKFAGVRDDRSKDDLRRAVRIKAGGGYDFSYLRFVRDQDEAWRPAAGRFEKWPRTAAEIRVLDPCCGSGHFLVEALELLTRLRMEEEGLSVQEAVSRVLCDNLHGLEIDPRCTQIAAFNLAFAAWRIVGRPFELPRLNVACSGLAPNCTESVWRAVAARAEAATGMEGKRDLFGAEPTLATGPIQDGMAVLHRVFQRASDYGSLIDPEVSLKADLFQADFKAVREVLRGILAREKQRSDYADYERAVAAEGMARAVELLTSTYTLVVTNVPFLARGKQSAVLRSFAEAQHGEAKGDLATLFVARILRWLGASGTQALVTPQNWLFLKSYRKLRERLLKRRTYNMATRLGPGAFETISGHVVNVSLNILSADGPTSDWQMAGLDVSATRGQTPIRTSEKASLLAGPAPVHLAKQKDQLKNPDAAILLHPIGDRTLLSTVAHGHQGIATADNACFGRKFWEMSPGQSHSRSDLDKWIWWQSTVRATTHYGGRENVVYWEAGQGTLQRRDSVRIQGGGIWNRLGVAVSQMGALPVTLYTGEKFDPNVAGVGPLDKESLLAVWAYCASPEYSRDVREINQKLNVTNATLVKVPFDLEHWTKVAKDLYPHGLPEPYSDDPTQWLFHGHPCGSVVWDEAVKQLIHGPLRTNSTVLQVAVARLLGHRWPAENDAKMRLSDQSREWVERSAELAHFADGDGIVCIPPVGRELSAQDRLRELLAAAYGSEWSAATERALLASTREGQAPASIDDWLRDGFFKQHCRLFHNRPFVWHVWDGRADGFHALVNYHRLAGADGEGRRTLDALTYHYLGDWIERQRADQQEGKAGADARLAAALDLRAQLERIATGNPPVDLFVRWRPLHHQPIGWEPDIDDGVRLNIRPFMRAELRTGGRKGAGILRWKPSVKWGKDRGKEPERDNDTSEHVRPREHFPWFWSCPGGGTEQQRTDFQGGPDFDGNRWNDLHYTRAVKAAARQAAVHEAATHQAAHEAATREATAPNRRCPGEDSAKLQGKIRRSPRGRFGEAPGEDSAKETAAQSPTSEPTDA